MPIKLESIDHVAIRVTDLTASAEWYTHVLGLKKTKLKAWGEFPIFMLSGTFGVALFPHEEADPAMPTSSKNIKIDHFAFRVNNQHFQLAQTHFRAIDISFDFQDHTYFHSIYLKDPDGHTVELTTPVSKISEADILS